MSKKTESGIRGADALKSVSGSGSLANLSTSPFDEGYGGSLPTFKDEKAVTSSNPTLANKSVPRVMGVAGLVRNPLREMSSKESFGRISTTLAQRSSSAELSRDLSQRSLGSQQKNETDRVATIDLDDEDVAPRRSASGDHHQTTKMNPLRRVSNYASSEQRPPAPSFESNTAMKRWAPMTDLTRDSGNDESSGSPSVAASGSSERTSSSSEEGDNIRKASQRSSSSTYSNPSPASSSSFTASFSSQSSSFVERNASADFGNTTVGDLPSYGTRTEIERRPKTAPGQLSPSNSREGLSSKGSMGSLASSMAKLGVGYSAHLGTLAEENESVASEKNGKGGPNSAQSSKSQQQQQPHQHHSIMNNLQKSAARWSKLPMLLPNTLKKLGAKREERAGASSLSHSKPSKLSTSATDIVKANTAENLYLRSDAHQNEHEKIGAPPPAQKFGAGKRSVSAGRILRPSPNPNTTTNNTSNPLLRRLIAGKSADKGKEKHPGPLSSLQAAPTSIPVASQSKLGSKNNQVVPAAVQQHHQIQQAKVEALTKLSGAAQKVGAATLSGSGNVAASSGTIWDDESKQASARHSTSTGAATDSDGDSLFVKDKAKFDREYKVLKQLGSGGHSTVRLATKLDTQSPVVLKFIRNSSVWHWATSPITGRKYPLEIHVMRKFLKSKSQNIIKYLEHFELNGKYIIVMEYLGEDWVDLYDYIEIYGPVREDITAEIFGQVVNTILYLYKKGFHHNDIKDENILINTKTRQIKLIDFGSATAVEPNKTCELFYGTKKFAAPEAVRGEPYYPEAQEVWALGTLLFVLLFKLDPFTTDEEILTTDIGRRIARYRNVSSSKSAGGSSSAVGSSSQTLSSGSTGGGLDISDEAVKSLKLMMEKDCAKRVSLQDIRFLPIFRKWAFDFTFEKDDLAEVVGN
ncbi:hypothetical protein HDU97_001876 [Phlyctochytrium planicorne]|nr:hypothetical protein HDU97_001876 [Phlyctochytrium planicorne]